MKKNSWSVWIVLFSSLVLSGCTTTITNLTPSTEKRNVSGLYPFEVELDTRERTIRKNSLQPYVLIGSQSYEMQPTPMVKNRWETLVPIPPNKEFIPYRFKFNYQYNSIPKVKVSSKLSKPYQLQIVDK